MKFSVTLAVGQWGGIYIRKGWSKGLCLGWVAITFMPADVEEILVGLTTKIKNIELASTTTRGNA